MKTLLLVLAVLGWLVLNAPAQVTIEVTQDQDQFLLGEALPVAVKITNLSGQKVHLGEEPNWLTFNIESMDGFEVFKSAEVPVVGAFDLESSQMGIKDDRVSQYRINH